MAKLVWRLTAATRVEIVRAQVSTMGQRARHCELRAAKLPIKGRYPATFRSLFGDVPVRIQLRICACRCRADTLMTVRDEPAFAVAGSISRAFASSLIASLLQKKHDRAALAFAHCRPRSAACLWEHRRLSPVLQANGNRRLAQRKLPASG